MYSRSAGWRNATLVGAALALPGCALVWDAPDGRRHVLGYHVTASPVADPAGEVTALDVVGAAVIVGQQRSAAVLGLLRERQVALGPSMAVRVQCLECEPQAIGVLALDPGRPAWP